MLSKKEELANADWWTKRQPVFIETYQAIYAQKDLSISLKEFGSLDRCADVYIGESFHLLMVDAVDLAREAAEYAQNAAIEALNSESFEKWVPLQFRTNLGKYKATRTLYYADWILNGVRSAPLLSQSLMFHFEAYGYGKEVWYDVQDVLMDYAHSDLKQQGREVAAFILSKGIEKGDKTTNLLMAILNDDGKVENLPADHAKCLKNWQKKSRQWCINSARLTWWLRLNWILLSMPLNESRSLQELKP